MVANAIYKIFRQNDSFNNFSLLTNKHHNINNMKTYACFGNILLYKLKQQDLQGETTKTI